MIFNEYLARFCTQCDRVVKLPVIYVGGKLPVTYRPLPARTGHRALVLKGVGQSLGPVTVIITR